ncbi:MAG: glycosyltransferase family 39 protein [Candidatus Saganbacteria bacterium]|nr:glycosyltransferase family 39 protein [Candidatus Saganbacteria bacterium]
MNLVLFLIGLNLAKLFLVPYFPLIGDEGYYWLWGQHPAWGYLDHPPLIAYVNYLLTAVFGPSELAVRCCALGLVLLTSVIIYLTGKELYGEKAGAAAAVLFNLLPTVFGGGLFLVPQLLLLFFFALSFYLFARIIRRRSSGPWYWLGVTAGLGLLSDFGMALFALGVLVYLLIEPEQRFWLARKEPYLAALISLALLVPLIGWEASRHWPSFSYHGSRASGPWLYNFAYSALLQLALYTPPLFFAACRNAVRLLTGRDRSLPAVMSSAVFLPFTLLSFPVILGGHWTATAYLPVLLQTAEWKRRWRWAAVCFALAVALPALAYFLRYPVPAELAGREYRLNRQLPAYLSGAAPRAGRTYIISNNLGVAGLVAFHGRVRTYLPPGRHPQYDLWGKPELKRGDNVIYFALGEPELAAKLKPLFARLTADEQPRLFAKDSDIPTRTVVYAGAGFRGGTLP